MKRWALFAVSGLFTTMFIVGVVTVSVTVEEDGSGRVGGVVYCLPWAQCED